VDAVFKALADASRRELLDRLFQRNGQTLLELTEGLEMTRFGVMKHLAVLEEAGLITTRKVGREKHHFLNPVPIRLIHDRWVSKYAAPFAAALVQLKQTVEGAMAGQNTQIYQVFIDAPPERVWQAITDPAFSKRVPFFFRVESTFAVGDPIRWVMDDRAPAVEGEVIESDPPRLLVHTWVIRYDPRFSRETSRVTWRIEPKPGAGRALTKLTVEHDVTGAPLTAGHVSIDGWSYILSGIKTLVETGEPITSLEG
jgi:uncharacterized protein YndB with AHSA1/START domain/DNA-binding transcriptional ArsR family regulator